ncbi:cytochrome c oxidase subunit II [Effusibacillus lacus]|uniref:Cytochrome aa3 subunit 2 n=1 Tax=Effusibacillus lacus TaxID=1348429 RepID=A0A292YI46_9BACL|nr:cytochrome c oxidase subunit II [Effusibacillus lacus]TCS74638.1 cytochrome c oxidase subunit 2 [Effusibacillus lacus]GAX88509.1 cytochrome b5 [Effusibacillus lacus]
MHIHRYEKYWLMFGGGIIIAFIVALFVNAFAMGMTPPSDLQRVDPKKVEQTAPFDKPGLKQVGPNEYEAVMVSFAFGYNPNQIEVPVGSKVTFISTSKDVVHGFQIPGTNVNMMVVPGHVNKVTHTFDKPGEYLILCNEYCGAAHHMMMAKVIVK